MTDKAYIVVNEKQEREVLGKLERWGAKWYRSKSKPTDFIPSHVEHTTKLPYALLVENAQISWCDIEALYEFDDIVYDGRKEEQMRDKYVVSQKFIYELKSWKQLNIDSLSTAINEAVFNLDGYKEVYAWLSANEVTNRLIEIIRWVNGEDVFEVEKPKKWVVRYKEPQGSVDGKPLYKWFVDEDTVELEATMPPYVDRFDTKEEAESWANAHQEVIEVDE